MQPFALQRVWKLNEIQQLTSVRSDDEGFIDLGPAIVVLLDGVED